MPSGNYALITYSYLFFLVDSSENVSFTAQCKQRENHVWC